MPKIPFIEFIKNRGVHSGLGQTSNSIKMAGLILLPLIAPWIVLQIFFDKATSNTLTPVVLFLWVIALLAYYWAKKAAASEYTVFPQAGIQFADGQQIRYDILVNPNRGEGDNGWEAVMINDIPVKYSDGSQVYICTFKDKLSYQDPKRDLPDIFDQAYIKTPASWTESFDFNGFGEFFYEGLFITHAKCENAEFTECGWEERGGSRIPILVVSSCSFFHKQVRKFSGKAFAEVQVEAKQLAKAVIADLKKRNAKLQQRNQYLEVEAERHDKEEPAIIKERVDAEKDKILQEYSDVMDIKPPLGRRLIKWLNAKHLFYLAALAVAVFIVMWLLGLV